MSGDSNPPTPPPNTGDTDIDDLLNDLCVASYYKGKGNKQISLTDEVNTAKAAITKMLRAERLDELTNSFREFSKDVPFAERLAYYDRRNIELQTEETS